MPEARANKLTACSTGGGQWRRYGPGEVALGLAQITEGNYVNVVVGSLHAQRSDPAGSFPPFAIDIGDFKDFFSRKSLLEEGRQQSFVVRAGVWAVGPTSSQGCTTSLPASWW